jgi:pyrimidine-specific ribonucleoside hydrolase
VLITIATNTLYPHPWKPSEYIVIDTDGGIDDFRTINLLLASPSVRVLGISCSNGVLSAGQTHEKLLGLLEATHHQGILSSINNSELSIAKGCSTAVNFRWGDVTQQSDTILSHIQMLNHILNNTKERVTLLNLASLRTTVSYAKNINNLIERTNKILWINDYQDINNSFNYLIDTLSFKETIARNIPIQIINGAKNITEYATEYPEKLQKTGMVHALKTASSFSAIQSPYKMKIFDETGAIYIHFPDFFLNDTINEFRIHSSLLPNISEQDINQCLLQIIQGETMNKNQLFSSFPMNVKDYADDIKPITEQTIYRFGKNEWIACVLTMEMHRHVGTYALIGAKMGIVAREYFGAGIDEVEIVTYSGSTPPYSCLNDGLQVSTGATLGHGLIHHAKTKEILPAAEFEYLGQKIRIELKKNFRNQIKQEIKEARMLYGLESDEYWDLVRLRTIYYWSKWDRNKIFKITKIL